jgi:plasmid maintenance system antidote protein VapI
LQKESQKEGIPIEVRVSKYFFYKSEAVSGELEDELGGLEEEVGWLEAELDTLANAYVTPFGRILQKIRRDKRLRLDVMAEKLGIGPSELSEMETARKRVTTEIVDTIIREFELSERSATELRNSIGLDNQNGLRTKLSSLDCLPPNVSKKDTRNDGV